MDVTVVLYVFSGLSICTAYLSIFYRLRAFQSRAFWATWIAWWIFAYEFLSLFCPVLHVPAQYRDMQYRAEHGFLAIYFWHAAHYTYEKLVAKIRNQDS